MKGRGQKKRFGLVGRNISYSFSRGYFTKKFENLGLKNHSYENFDLQEIGEFETLLKNNQDIKGLNVTIPYKQEILPFLNEIEDTALEIGAVNTIRIAEGKLYGYNTDVVGFRKSLEPHLKPHHKCALILGTGGASKAVAYVLDQLGISYKFVSRKPGNVSLSYNDLDEESIAKHNVIVNCTPLGTHPDIESRPDIPYGFLEEGHLLFDLIYNPPKTAFLRAGEERGSSVLNGQNMLELQAEAAWHIWNS